jgi:hypothetical protein
MKGLLSEKLAARVLMFIFSVSMVFHILVVLQVIPFQMVWGGRLKDKNQMILFETFSLVITTIMLLVVGIQLGLLKTKISYKVIRVCLLIMTALFVLNTVGNLNSINKWERMIFTPVTLILSILCFRLAIADKKIVNN